MNGVRPPQELTDSMGVPMTDKSSAPLAVWIVATETRAGGHGTREVDWDDEQ